MSGGKKQTTTSNQTASTTTQLPAWLTQAGQDLYGKAMGSIPANAGQAYAAPMTAGPSQNQATASELARANAGTWQGDMNASRQMTTAAAAAPAANVQSRDVTASTYTAAGNGQAPSVAAGNVNAGEFGAAEAAKYMNPYQQLVQSNTLEQMRQQGEQERASLNDSVQGAKAFGGTRQAVLESELAKNQAQQRNDYVDSSNAAAFSDAQAAFERDRQARMAAETGNADRSLNAQTTNASFLDQLLGRIDTANQFNAQAQNDTATANADRGLDASKTNAGLWEQMLSRIMGGGEQMGKIAEASSSLGTQDVANLSATGATDQATDQAGKDAEYQEWLRARSEPLDMYSQLMEVLNGTPRNVTTSGTTNGSTTQKTSGSFLDTLMGLGSLGIGAAKAGVFSDPRLKKDVGLIERLANGLGIYRYRYLWERPTDDLHIGVMADEVARIAPEALGPIVAGYLTVNYGKLEEMLA